MTLQLSIPPNVLYPNTQTLNIEKIATLIGENGSGKSSILHCIFDQKLSKKDFEELRLVSFTSGQNENFSQRFASYLKKHVSNDNDLNLDIFHFDKSWSKLLIFLATTTRRQGRVRKYLEASGYVDTNEQEDDISSSYHAKFKIEAAYSARILDALKEESSGEITETIRTTSFHLALENFIENCVDADYSFEKAYPTKDISLNSKDLLKVSFPEKPNAEATSLPQNATLNFFIKAAGNSYFLDTSNNRLTFKNDLELDQVSDGEYQLLFVYALLDLLDSDATLFLFDEADSHLHYKNIDSLWSVLKAIKGHVITTTHLLDSITSNDHSSLSVVEKGQISENNKLKKLIERLKVLSRARNVEFEICARIPLLALMDDYNDWEIFKKLAERKGLDVSVIQNVCALKKTSGYAASTENFAEKKVEWAQELGKSVTDLTTSQIFLICDCDEASLEFIENGVQVAGKEYKDAIRSIRWPNNQSVAVHLLAWKRREIKNYLLSYTALSHYSKLAEVNNNSLAADDHLTSDNPGDNDGIRRLRAKGIVDPLVNENSSGLDSQKLQAYIDLIPPSEISEDIEKMYNFIAEKLA